MPAKGLIRMLKKFISLLLAAVTLFGCAAVFAIGTSALEDPEISNAASAYLYNIENSPMRSPSVNWSTSVIMRLTVSPSV